MEIKFWNERFWFIRENQRLLTKRVWISKTTRSIFNSKFWREQIRLYNPKAKQNVLSIDEVVGRGVPLNEQHILNNVYCSWVSILRLTHWTSLEVQRLRGANTQRSFCYTWEMFNLPILIVLLGIFYQHFMYLMPVNHRAEIMFVHAQNFANTHGDSTMWKVLLSIPKTHLSPSKDRMGFFISTGAFGGRISKRERHQIKKVKTKQKKSIN